MNKAQIKAELRRGAELDYPDVHCIAFYAASAYVDYYKDEWISSMLKDEKRTFFLLVAEAQS